MKHQILKAIALAVLLVGCESYTVKDSPAVKAEAMPYTQAEGPLLVGADPYVQPDKAKEVFGADLLAADVIALQIVVRNTGERPIRVETKNFRLSLPSGEVAAPRPAVEVAALFNPKTGLLDHASTGIGLVGRFAGAIGGLVAGVAGNVVSGSIKGSQKDVFVARQQDYARKELKGVALGKNESTRGFLFFSVPAGTPAFDEAALILDLYESDAKSVSIKLPLKGLGYKPPSGK